MATLSAGRDAPIGPQEIATLLDVKVDTVHTWQRRRIMPAPKWIISGVPLWTRSQINQWAQATGRLS